MQHRCGGIFFLTNSVASVANARNGRPGVKQLILVYDNKGARRDISFLRNEKGRFGVGILDVRACVRSNSS
jgi:hypothetical protein